MSFSVHKLRWLFLSSWSSFISESLLDSESACTKIIENDDKQKDCTQIWQSETLQIMEDHEFSPEDFKDVSDSKEEPDKLQVEGQFFLTWYLLLMIHCWCSKKDNDIIRNTIAHPDTTNWIQRKESQKECGCCCLTWFIGL